MPLIKWTAANMSINSCKGIYRLHCSRPATANRWWTKSLRCCVSGKILRAKYGFFRRSGGTLFQPRGIWRHKRNAPSEERHSTGNRGWELHLCDSSLQLWNVFRRRCANRFCNRFWKRYLFDVVMQRHNEVRWKCAVLFPLIMSADNVMS